MATKKSAAKPKVFKFPASLPACLKLLGKLQEASDLLQVKLGPIQAEEQALRDHLINTFKKTELDGMKAHGLSLSIVTTTVPTLSDFAKFLKFAMKKGNDDLLQRSVNTPAWRERMGEGKQVPGVEPFTRIGLRVSKVVKP